MLETVAYDVYMWGNLKYKISSNNHNILAELKQSIRETITSIKVTKLKAESDSLFKRLEEFLGVEERHLEHPL
jgi:hypothetical protein